MKFSTDNSLYSKASLLFVGLALFAIHVSAQKPYFQQKVDSKIRVSLDDVAKTLTGDIDIVYHNNSPDTLKEIFIHLWPNAYKHNQTVLGRQLLENGSKDFFFADESQRGYIDQLSFSSEGNPLDWEVMLQEDIASVNLKKPLLPGSSAKISTPFRVKLPSADFSRLGYKGNSYFITQWYPKPAVYDNDGWNPMSYLDKGEFYSEFGDYDVEITLPNDYKVAATGVLQDSSELKWLHNQFPGYMQDSVVSKEAGTQQFYSKTLHFKQQNTHDFAWFADPDFFVLKRELFLPYKNERTTLWGFFPPSAVEGGDSTMDAATLALRKYSNWLGVYPYSEMKLVVPAREVSGFGMEYPGLAVLSLVDPKEEAYSPETTVHEVGHSWLYGALANNERQHAWMDEGLNQYYEGRFFEEQKAYDKGGKYVVNEFSIPGKLYLDMASLNQDQAISNAADIFTNENYDLVNYTKTAGLFKLLESFLGKAVFDSAMHTYYRQWAFKHPKPEDLEKVLEESSHQDLDWLFKNSIQTTNLPDYKITAIKDGFATVVNKGINPQPFQLASIRKGQIQQSLWLRGFYGMQQIPIDYDSADAVTIDPQLFLFESNYRNNTIRTKGLFPKLEPLKIKVFSERFPSKYRSYLTISSILLGWNSYNKWMFGLAINNQTEPLSRVSYFIAPIIAYKGQFLNGYGGVAYNIRPKKGPFYLIDLGLNAATFTYASIDAYNSNFKLNYRKVSPYLRLSLKKPYARSTTERYFQFRVPVIYQDEMNYGDSSASVTSNTYTYFDFSFTADNRKAVNPIFFKAAFQAGDGFTKETIEIKSRITYKRVDKAAELRFFAGLFQSKSYTGIASFRTSGYEGYQDYLYDDIFIGRTETKGILSRQFVESDAAMKVATPLGNTESYILALNVKLPMPKLPIGLFADVCAFGKNEKTIYLNSSFLYDGGLYLSIYKEVFQVYMPLFMNKDIRDVFETNNLTKFSDYIRFSLNLKVLNPYKSSKYRSF